MSQCQQARYSKSAEEAKAERVTHVNLPEEFGKHLFFEL
jgi:hypothetical protein